MTFHYAFGAAVYFDHELVREPAPIATLLETLGGRAAKDGTLVQWMNRVDGRRMPPGKPYELATLIRKATEGEMRAVAIETPPKTDDRDFLLVLTDTTPVPKLREPLGRAWRYRMHAAFGAARLEALGPDVVLDAILAFADAVVAKAGVALWGETAEYASTAAWSVGFTNLPPAQRDRLYQAMYWENRWGEVIRGPAWGTFLSADHVARLGGLDRIRRDSGCARTMSLPRSDGAFLQVTPIAEPILDHDDRGALAGLTRFLEPVSGARPT